MENDYNFDCRVVFFVNAETIEEKIIHNKEELIKAFQSQNDCRIIKYITKAKSFCDTKYIVYRQEQNQQQFNQDNQKFLDEVDLI